MSFTDVRTRCSESQQVRTGSPLRLRRRVVIAMLGMVMAGMVLGRERQIMGEVMGPTVFGKTKEGVAVESFTLKNGNGVIAKLMTLGATITELHVPDKNGKLADVVLGFDDVAGYESDRNQHFGCTTGRVCNRIAKAKFTLDGKEYRLAVNNGPNHLHGGVKRSLDRVVWQAETVKVDGASAVKFRYSSPDGEEGFPGKLDVTVTYTLTEKNELRIEFLATTDKATPVNLTNHSYFHLGGAGSSSVLDHELQVAATSYTPTDETLIPTGKIAACAGTALDFRQPTKLGARMADLLQTPAMGYDHNFVLSPREAQPTLAARVKDPQSGRVMTVSTTQPGVQVYSGNFLKGQTAKQGKSYAKQSAMCLETQHFPDSVNQPTFPTTIVKPGETYRHTCVYAFSAE